MNVGYPGGGGEYIVQEGFGWTNGVVLWIMDKFGSNLTLPSECLRIERDIFFKKDEINDSENNNYERRKDHGRISLIIISVVLKIFLFLKVI